MAKSRFYTDAKTGMRLERIPDVPKKAGPKALEDFEQRVEKIKARNKRKIDAWNKAHAAAKGKK